MRKLSLLPKPSSRRGRIALVALLALGGAAAVASSTNLAGYFTLDTADGGVGSASSPSGFQNAGVVVTVGGEASSSSGFTSSTGALSPVASGATSVGDWQQMADQ